MPEGLPNPTNKVCKIKKSLYGLKQASRQWFAKLTTELKLQGYVQSKNDYSLFLKRHNGLITIAVVYVDDIILTGGDTTEIDHLKSHLDSIFSINDLGKLHFFLGLEVGYHADGIVLTQAKFTKELLDECGIKEFRKVYTPLLVNLKLSVDGGGSSLYADPILYRTLVGKLNYLSHTRPDLSFSVQTLSQFMHSPRDQHFEALTHVLSYVKAIAGQGILLQGSPDLVLQAFSDSDWASCKDSRRSVTGYLLLLGKSPVSWKSKKQATVSRSSSEAEYRAMASAASEAVWLVRLFARVRCVFSIPCCAAL